MAASPAAHAVAAGARRRGDWTSVAGHGRSRSWRKEKKSRREEEERNKNELVSCVTSERWIIFSNFTDLSFMEHTSRRSIKLVNLALGFTFFWLNPDLVKLKCLGKLFVE
jgi:hypothetical protein